MLGFAFVWYWYLLKSYYVVFYRSSWIQTHSIWFLVGLDYYHFSPILVIYVISLLTFFILKLNNFIAKVLNYWPILKYILWIMCQFLIGYILVTSLFVLQILLIYCHYFLYCIQFFSISDINLTVEPLLILRFITMLYRYLWEEEKRCLH